MKIIRPSYYIKTDLSEENVARMLKDIEEDARTCYKSEDKIVEEECESAKKLLERLIASGHEAMLEHSQLSVKFICDRGVSHEIVRHRLCSFAQESTRYCNYSKDKFDNEITVIEPSFYHGRLQEYATWRLSCEQCERTYFSLLETGSTPQEARSVLPHSLKTEIVVTANFREWRNILKLRTAPDAHPQIRELMIPLLYDLQDTIPVIFDDIEAEENR